jgi:hypothetical protein
MSSKKMSSKKNGLSQNGICVQAQIIFAYSQHICDTKIAFANIQKYTSQLAKVAYNKFIANIEKILNFNFRKVANRIAKLRWKTRVANIRNFSENPPLFDPGNIARCGKSLARSGCLAPAYSRFIRLSAGMSSISPQTFGEMFKEIRLDVFWGPGVGSWKVLAAIFFFSCVLARVFASGLRHPQKVLARHSQGMSCEDFSIRKVLSCEDFSICKVSTNPT